MAARIQEVLVQLGLMVLLRKVRQVIEDVEDVVEVERWVVAGRVHLRYDFDIQGQGPCAEVGEVLALAMPRVRQHKERLKSPPVHHRSCQDSARP